MVERAQVFVIDASVAVKWYVAEKGQDSALNIRDDYSRGRIDLVAPILLIYEVFNALRYHPSIPARAAAKCMDSLLDMQLDLRSPSSETNTLTALLAYDERISIYDAEYLALANFVQAKLITADSRFMNRLSPIRRREVRLLENYQ